MHHGIKRSTRRAFTLVELLIAVAIMGTLAAITLLAVGRTRESEELRNTSVTLGVIDNMLQTQMRIVLDKAKRDPLPDSYLIAANGDQDKARAQYLTDVMRENFPEKTGESTKQAFTGLGNENADYLLKSIGLARGGANMVSGDEQLSYAMQDNRRYVDAWGTPIRFKRFINASSTEFSAVLADLQAEAASFPAVAGKNVGSTGKPSFNVLDPQGKLTGSEDTLLKFGMFCYSAGPDKTYGTGDDILSFRLRKTGQQGN